MIDLMSIKYKADAPAIIGNPSAITNYSRLSSLSKKTGRELSMMRNESIMSRVISEKPYEEEIIN